MKIPLRCPCGNLFSASDDGADKNAQCPQCGRDVLIPSVEHSLPPTEETENPWLRFRCGCGFKIKAPKEWAGKKGHCPKCGNPIVMPMPETVSATNQEPPAAAPKAEDPSMASGIMSVTRETEEVIVNQAAPEPAATAATTTPQADTPVPVVPATGDAPAPKQREMYRRSESIFEPLIRRHQKIVEYFDKNRALTIALSLAALATGVVIIYLQLMTPDEDLDANRTPIWIEKPREVYFYDIDSQTVFAHSMANPPPIHTPTQQPTDQPHGFRAFVYSCGECSPEKWYIGHLETFDPVAREAWARRMRARRRPDMPEAAVVPNADFGRYIVDPADKDTLHDAASPEAKEVLARDTKPCADGSLPRLCEPPQAKR